METTMKAQPVTFGEVMRRMLVTPGYRETAATSASAAAFGLGAAATILTAARNRGGKPDMIVGEPTPGVKVKGYWKRAEDDGRTWVVAVAPDVPRLYAIAGENEEGDQRVTLMRAEEY
jgi:hypothetical protein